MEWDEAIYELWWIIGYSGKDSNGDPACLPEDATLLQRVAYDAGVLAERDDRFLLCE